MFNRNKPFEAEPQDRSPGTDLTIPSSPEPVKRPEPTPMTSSASSSRSSNLSTLSAGVKYEGNISGAGELQVDGSLKGDIRVVQVTIGEGGSVEGSVHADALHIRGRVSGTIVAKQVHLYATARVEGDITQEQISIDKGAWFQGRSTQAKRDATPKVMATPAATPVESSSPSGPERLTTKKD
jgi:cytoskeletal protein CcmA (bactofilin family)